MSHYCVKFQRNGWRRFWEKCAPAYGLTLEKECPTLRSLRCCFFFFKIFTIISFKNYLSRGHINFKTEPWVDSRKQSIQAFGTTFIVCIGVSTPTLPLKSTTPSFLASPPPPPLKSTNCPSPSFLGNLPLYVGFLWIFEI